MPTPTLADASLMSHQPGGLNPSDSDGEPLKSCIDLTLDALVSNGTAIVAWRRFWGTFLGTERLREVYACSAREAISRWGSTQTLSIWFACVSDTSTTWACMGGTVFFAHEYEVNGQQIERHLNHTKTQLIILLNGHFFCSGIIFPLITETNCRAMNGVWQFFREQIQIILKKPVRLVHRLYWLLISLMMPLQLSKPMYAVPDWVAALYLCQIIIGSELPIIKENQNLSIGVPSPRRNVQRVYFWCPVKAAGCVRTCSCRRQKNGIQKRLSSQCTRAAPWIFGVRFSASRARGCRPLLEGRKSKLLTAAVYILFFCDCLYIEFIFLFSPSFYVPHKN